MKAYDNHVFSLTYLGLFCSLIKKTNESINFDFFFVTGSHFVGLVGLELTDIHPLPRVQGLKVCIYGSTGKSSDHKSLTMPV